MNYKILIATGCAQHLRDSKPTCLHLVEEEEVMDSKLIRNQLQLFY